MFSANKPWNQLIACHINTSCTVSFHSPNWYSNDMGIWLPGGDPIQGIWGEKSKQKKEIKSASKFYRHTGCWIISFIVNTLLDKLVCCVLLIEELKMSLFISNSTFLIVYGHSGMQQVSNGHYKMDAPIDTLDSSSWCWINIFS